MIIIVVLLSFLAPLVVPAPQPWKALDPEQTLYVYKRCFEDHLPSGSTRRAYIKFWIDCKLEPNDPITHCYVKCALAGLQYYDPEKNTFKAERIPIQYQAYKHFFQVKQEEVSKFQNALATTTPKTNSCVDLYNAYIPIHNKFLNVSRQLYHGRNETNDIIYAARPDIKQKYESFHAYCERRAWKDKKQSEWKQGRNYELSGSPELKQAIDCIFHGLRYMDDTGLRVDEIVRDFNLINKSELGPKVRQILETCSGSEAYDYYSCLLNSDLKEDFKEAFDYHELRSADYAYLLLQNVYIGPEKVKEALKKLTNI
ncbi:37 kDa salivary gland allergen Aed a 2-like [Anopheles maculipalpis]|uniref:37 kDa salivary gland allergen Aed a 2-like n=1 Tax=Anopheles maculipalpis TaxID=1496333 RepID=UPI002159B200|nr:37 kDa salivary gland allergen Aed a 2-like [Anopheles maculipalpis]